MTAPEHRGLAEAVAAAARRSTNSPGASAAASSSRRSTNSPGANADASSSSNLSSNLDALRVFDFDDWLMDATAASRQAKSAPNVDHMSSAAPANGMRKQPGARAAHGVSAGAGKAADLLPPPPAVQMKRKLAHQAKHGGGLCGSFMCWVAAAALAFGAYGMWRMPKEVSSAKVAWSKVALATVESLPQRTYALAVQRLKEMVSGDLRHENEQLKADLRNAEKRQVAEEGEFQHEKAALRQEVLDARHQTQKLQRKVSRAASSLSLAQEKVRHERQGTADWQKKAREWKTRSEAAESRYEEAQRMIDQDQKRIWKEESDEAKDQTRIAEEEREKAELRKELAISGHKLVASDADTHKLLKRLSDEESLLKDASERTRRFKAAEKTLLDSLDPVVAAAKSITVPEPPSTKPSTQGSKREARGAKPAAQSWASKSLRK